MLACVDVDYREDVAVAGCILFSEWKDARPQGEIVARSRVEAPYRPGRFYLRELPALRTVLAEVRAPLSTVIVDGYVWLGEEPGLGARLHGALDGNVPVIGVAKTRWVARGGSEGDNAKSHGHDVVSVLRGRSSTPLFVTAIGIDPCQAARWIASMHGAHRMPTLLEAVDRLVRSVP